MVPWLCLLSRNIFGPTCCPRIVTDWPNIPGMVMVLSVVMEGSSPSLLSKNSHGLVYCHGLLLVLSVFNE